MIRKFIYGILEYIRNSKGFMTAAGQILDYVEWHVFVRGMLLPFLAIMFTVLFDIRFVLYADAALLCFSAGIDMVEYSNEWLQKLRKESQYFMYGHAVIFTGYALSLQVNPILMQWIRVCL